MKIADCNLFWRDNARFRTQVALHFWFLQENTLFFEYLGNVSLFVCVCVCVCKRISVWAFLFLSGHRCCQIEFSQMAVLNKNVKTNEFYIIQTQHVCRYVTTHKRLKENYFSLGIQHKFLKIISVYRRF